MQEEYQDYSSFLEAKNLRKQAEEDARLLSNRLMLLKQEELKALKKIEETRKKAKEIMEVKARNLEIQRQKEEKERQKIEEERLKLLDIQNTKALERQQREVRIQSARAKNHNDAKALKEQLQENLEVAERKKQEDLMMKTGLNNQVKAQKSIAQEKRRQISEARRNQAREDLEKRIREQESYRREFEDAVARMEQEELELIQRLQNTQLMQQSVYEDLEAAMKS